MHIIKACNLHDIRCVSEVESFISFNFPDRYTMPSAKRWLLTMWTVLKHMPTSKRWFECVCSVEKEQLIERSLIDSSCVCACSNSLQNNVY